MKCNILKAVKHFVKILARFGNILRTFRNISGTYGNMPDFREHFEKIRILTQTYCDIKWVWFLPQDPKLILALTIFGDMIFCRAPFLKISVRPRWTRWRGRHSVNNSNTVTNIGNKGLRRKLILKVNHQKNSCRFS